MENEAVLVLSGLDPSGAAGISADIETLKQFRVTALPIITTLTVQNTQSVVATQSVDAQLIAQQFNHLQDDIEFAVVKIGLLSSSKQIQTIADLTQGKTIVLDPIVCASTGKGFLDAHLIDTLKQQLLPLVKIITPNNAELQALSGEHNEQLAIGKLNCEWVLLTAADSCEAQIEHRLYHHKKIVKCFYYKKLPGNYHGSGCTLASAIAALLALGLAVDIACGRALDYTYQTLLNANSIGKMQYHPNRYLNRKSL